MLQVAKRHWFIGKFPVDDVVFDCRNGQPNEFGIPTAGNGSFDAEIFARPLLERCNKTRKVVASFFNSRNHSWIITADRNNRNRSVILQRFQWVIRFQLFQRFVHVSKNLARLRQHDCQTIVVHQFRQQRAQQAVPLTHFV